MESITAFLLAILGQCIGVFPVAAANIKSYPFPRNSQQGREFHRNDECDGDYCPNQTNLTGLYIGLAVGASLVAFCLIRCLCCRKPAHNVPDDQEEFGFSYYFTVSVVHLMVLWLFPLSLIAVFKKVGEYERAVVFRLGRCIGSKGPGTIFWLPCIDKLTIVNLSAATLKTSPQQIMTKDSATCSVNAVVYYRVEDPVLRAKKVEHVSQVEHVKVRTCLEHTENSIRFLAETTLRNVLGSFTLTELSSERGNIYSTMRELLNTETAPLGIKVENVEIKDVQLQPHQKPAQQIQQPVAPASTATKQLVQTVNQKLAENHQEQQVVVPASRQSQRPASRPPSAAIMKRLDTLMYE